MTVDTHCTARLQAPTGSSPHPPRVGLNAVTTSGPNPPSIPGVTWYIYGDFVLDMISNTRRSEYLNVATYDPELDTDTVRDALSAPKALSVIIRAAPHPVTYSSDAWVLTPDRGLYDIRSGEPVRVPWPAHVTPLTPDLDVRALLRLRYLLTGYPELQVDAPLLNKLHADVAFLDSVRTTYPEVATAFLEYEPISAWRVGIDKLNQSQLPEGRS